MLDRRYILENPDAIRANIANRQVNVDLDRFLELETLRRSLQQQVETVRAAANAVAKNNALSIDERRAEGKRLKEEEATIAAQIAPVEEEAQSILMGIPNLTYAGSPVGGEEASQDIARGATPIPTFSFKPKDHIELIEKLELVNLDAGAKVAGSGFMYYVGNGALLELALSRYALDIIMKHGFKPVITPDLARDALMQGAGFVPRGNESNTYHVEESDLNLIATSEITLVGMSADSVVDLAKPVQLAGMSHCFRSERAHGSATRGIYRVHQFTKTEMVVLCKPEDAETWHLKLRAIEQEIFDGLEIPYRVLEIATGDLGASAYRKFDLEAWMPGRGEGGSWGEITSTSNCTEYQARRLNIKYRDDAGKLQYAATLNGTAMSVNRPLIAILENNQQADGSVVLPKALVPYMGGLTHLRPESK